MTSSLDRLFPLKPDSRLRIYAWSPKNPPAGYEGLVKIGQTTKADVNQRIRQSQGQMQQEYTLHLDTPAQTAAGSTFHDRDVIERLKDKGFENPKLGSSREWVRCSVTDIEAVIAELKSGKSFSKPRYQTFDLRPEQQTAVDYTYEYFQSIWFDEPDVVPRYLWNAKMRFGKTFTAYQLAKKMEAKRVLVVTFKPAVQSAWQEDLESHVDFEGWQYKNASRMEANPSFDHQRPLVYFGSFQDLMGKDSATGAIKTKNEWLHTINWDLVIFDEYHFGAWREKARELFEGEDSKELEKEIQSEFSPSLKVFGEELNELDNSEKDFLPITTRAYLYLSGTPFKALASGEFIEEQIFNWTYTEGYSKVPTTNQTTAPPVAQ